MSIVPAIPLHAALAVGDIPPRPFKVRLVPMADGGGPFLLACIGRLPVGRVIQLDPAEFAQPGFLYCDIGTEPDVMLPTMAAVLAHVARLMKED